MTLLLPNGGDILLAHGLGGPTDLPIPLLYAMVGASWALIISFAVLVLAWKEPRFTAPASTNDLPERRPWLAIIGSLVVA